MVPNRGVGERIKTMRVALGMDRQALAGKLGVTTNAIAHWETGKTKEIPFITLIRVSDLLNVNSRWLALGDVPPGKAVFPSEDGRELIRLFDSLNEDQQVYVLERMREYVAGQKC